MLFEYIVLFGNLMLYITKHKLVGILMTISFSLFPIYFLPSGGLQVVDIAIIFLTLAMLIGCCKHEIQLGVYLLGPFVPLVVWVIIINAYYTMVAISEKGFLLSTIQVVYGFYILFLFSIVFQRILSSEKGVYFIYLSLFMASLTPWLLPESNEKLRKCLSFNNENQLAFYASLLYFMLILINMINIKMSKKYRINNNYMLLLNILIISSCNIFVFISLSRAGIISVALFNIYIIYFLLRLKMHMLLLTTLIILITIIGGMVAPFNDIQGEHSLTKLIKNNVVKMDERFSKGDLYLRTIGRIQFNNNLSIIIGNGGRKRADINNLNLENMFRKESHNTAGEIFNSYGIIGIFLLIIGTVIFISRLGLYPLKKWLLFVPLLVDHMTHNDFRFRFWWVALALFSIISLNIFRSQNTKKEGCYIE